MIRHYLTLEHVAAALDARLRGAVLADCFTQEKFCVVTMWDVDGGGFAVANSVAPNDGAIVDRPGMHRARKNVIDLFPSLVGQRCAAVTKHPDDRVVSYWLERAVLHVELFSAGNGNVVVAADGVVTDALKRAEQLRGIPYRIESGTDVRLGKYYAALGADHTAIEAQARASTAYYALSKGDEVLFSLLPLPGWNVDDMYTDVFEAIRNVQSRRRRMQRQTTVRKSLRRDLEARLRRVERSLAGMRSDEATRDRATDYRHLGDLLMAQPSPQRSGMDRIDIEDWDGNRRTITLDPTKTIIDNAAVYYRRARGADEAARSRAERIPRFERERTALAEALHRVETLPDLDSLERLQRSTMKTERGERPVEQRFRVFVLDDDHTLYVGKSAANNDELTMKFAKQNDWWFHARGVSGSHAILRGGSGTERPPKPVLEQAAAIAAWYSHARNASYTPVVYTQRKWVRKPKGANVGAVTLERETVVMVRPGLPAGHTDQE